MGGELVKTPDRIQELGAFMRANNMTPDSVPFTKQGSIKYILHPVSTAARAGRAYGQGTLSGSMRLASRSAPISHISISSIEIHRHLRSLKYSSMGYSCVYPDKDRIHPS